MRNYSQQIKKLSLEQRALFEAKLREKGIQLSQTNSIPPRKANEVIPLSFAQQRLWFVQQLEPDNSSYNVPCALKLEGKLDIRVLEQTLNEIVKRHEILRTIFVADDDKQPIQVVRAFQEFELPLIEVRSRGKRPFARTEDIINETIKTPFDLGKSLLRIKLIRLGEDRHILIIATHHIVSDRWSIGVFLKEIAILYQAFLRQQDSPLPQLPIQYADWSIWQKNKLQGGKLDKQVDYWKHKLQKLSVLELPCDRTQLPVPSYQGAKYFLALNKSLSDKIKALSNKAGVTLFTLLLTAFKVLLYRYSQQEDIVVGTDIANRDRTETEGLIGLLVNTLVLRTDLTGNPSFIELLQRVKQVSLEAFSHQDLSFEKLVEILNPERNLSQMMPLFQVKFDLQLAEVKPLELPDLKIVRLPLEESTVKYELRFNLQDSESGINGYVEYSTDLFDESTIARMVEHFTILLEGIVSNPQEKIAYLPLITTKEKEQIDRVNNTFKADPQHKSIAELFTAQANETPNAIAVIDRSQKITYQELEHKCDRVAEHLQSLGVKPEVRVGICVERSLDMIVGMLAILKAGGAYVPLDPNYPQARLDYIVEDSQISILLTQSQYEETFKNQHLTIIKLDCELPNSSKGECHSPLQPHPDNLAYIIYTSGSTGRPKGVAIAHKNALQLLYWGKEVFTPEELSGVLAATSICFDLSVFEIFVPLSWGGKVILAENALELPNLACKNEVRLINTVPSAIAELLHTDGIPNSVMTVNLAGESLKTELVERLYQRSHIQNVYNLYGPTEDTTYSTYARVEKSSRVCATIGKPVANTQVYVLDRHLQPVPIGVPGELYLASEKTARGYLNRPELTAEKFIPNPFSVNSAAHSLCRVLGKSILSQKPTCKAALAAPEPLGSALTVNRSSSAFSTPLVSLYKGDAEGRGIGGREDRLYKTGDLVKYLPNGNLEFLGRSDRQIKIRGYRLEIDEVETTLDSHPLIRESVVIAKEDNLSQSLIAYYAGANGYLPSPQLSQPELRQFLAQKLPSYAIPNIFVELDELPLLPNGKIDRKSLPTVDSTRPELTATYTAPQTEVEKTIAAIWKQELNLDRVGINDNFFDLGGHSLLGIRIVTYINEALSKEVALKSLFQYPTIAELAQQIETTAIGSSVSLPKIVPNPKAKYEPFPLTDIQQAYLIGRSSVFALGNVATHGYREIETVGISIDAVEKAWNKLIKRHEMLRMVVNGNGQQQILADVPEYKIKRSPLTPLTKGGIRDRLSHQIISLDSFPLFEIEAVQLGDDIRFCISFDVLIGDAWSFQLLAREMVQLLLDPDAELPQFDLSFRDYVLAEQKLRESELYQRSWDYWQQRIPNLPPAPELPLVKSLESVAKPHFTRLSHKLSRELWQKLKQKATEAKITPSSLLLTAFSEVLTTWAKSPQFTINLTLFNRLPLHPDVDKVVGDFTSSTLLEVDNRGQDSFTNRCIKIQSQLWQDLDHRYVSGIEILRELARNRASNTGGLMPVVFTSTLAQNEPESNSITRPGLAETVYSVSQTSQVYLDHQVGEIEGELVFNWDAIATIFPNGVLDDMFTAYCNLLEQLAVGANGYSPIWDDTSRNLLPDYQKELLAEVNATEINLQGSNLQLQDLFFAKVAENPQQIAVIDNDFGLTYQELGDRVKYLAHTLQQQLTESSGDRIVAIVLDKGWSQVVATLGILTAGAAYVPIDPDLPSDRALHILTTTNAQCIITTAKLANNIDWIDGHNCICIDRNPVGAIPGSPLRQKSQNLAYIIYTSGSTGMPKGVAISHQGAVNTILDINRRFEVNYKDCLLALSSLSFDLSVYDIFGTLAAGGTIVIPDADANKDAVEWRRLIEQHQITVWNSVPALMEMLVENSRGERLFALTDNSSLRLVMLSGDWIDPRLRDRIKNNYPQAKVISLGGATEASIWSIFYPIENVDKSWKSIPYGRPLANQYFKILNKNLEPCPLWVTGDLYIGGKGLADCYWRDELKTDSSFIIHPQSPQPPTIPPAPRTPGGSRGDRLYKTEDLGRYLPNGNIEFLGREDFQVKVNGYRIELGEIEASLQQHPNIDKVLVTAVGETSNKQLVAYIVPNQNNNNSLDKIEFKLQQPGIREIRKDETEITLALPEVDDTDAFISRQSYRQFLQQEITLNNFSNFLSCLRQIQLNNSPLPKYRYGSAGSLYPVQTYVYLKQNCVTGLNAGYYYYHPQKHSLISISQDKEINSTIYGVNKAIFERANFSIFLIGELNAIAPVYKEAARDFCLLEAGYISQLLMETAPKHDLGICPIGKLESDEIQNNLKLPQIQILLHSFVGGAIDPAWTKQWQQNINSNFNISIEDSLQEYLKQKLPDYMIPKSYIVLEKFPLTSNGKIDRHSLPLPDRVDRDKAEYIAPRNEIETKIVEIWQENLKLDQIGIKDNFFDLGGNSLSATQVCDRIRNTFNIELSIRQFFTTPTILEIAKIIINSQAIKPKEDSSLQIEKVSRESEVNLDNLSESEMDALLQQMISED